MKKTKKATNSKKPRQRTGRPVARKTGKKKVDSHRLPAPEDGQVATSKKKVKKATGDKKQTSRRKTFPPKKLATSKKMKKTPQTMEELLSMTGYKIRGLKKGDVIEAIITDIDRKAIFFDIGAKTEGILAEKEKEFISDFMAQLKVGDKLMAQVISPENEKGQILLSLKQAAAAWTWGLFEEYLKTGQPVEVRGLDVVRGGMVARFMGVRGFIPTSQFGRQYLGKFKNLYNRLFKVKVIEVDKKKNRLIFSEKQISEAEAIKAQEKALLKVNIGDVYVGIISGVMPFGIFVRVDVRKGKEKGEKRKEKEEELFLEGLVHISEISWEKVDNLPKLYKVGQKIEVKVIGVERETGKLTLSIKRLTPDPWEEMAKKYKKDTKVKGKVTRLAAFGAFVELAAGIEGLIHISKIPADMAIKVGSKIEVYIESLDIEQRRISLGLVLKEKPVGYK